MEITYTKRNESLVGFQYGFASKWVAIMTSSTDFWLLPAGLEEQAAVVDEWCAEYGKMNEALAEIVLGGEQGATIYNYAMGKASAMHSGILQWIAHMQNVLTAVAVELREVAAEGREIDLEKAARLDKYQPTEYNWYDPNPSGKFDAQSGTLAPSSDRYDKPDAPVMKPTAPNMGFYLDAGPGAFDSANDFTSGLFPDDLTSPSEWVRPIVERVGALSYRQQVYSGFGGDWIRLRWYAHKLDGIGTFLAESHGALKSTIGAVLIYWQGYSANSAGLYFDALLKGIDSVASGAKDASKSIGDYCDAVKSSAEIIGGEIESLCDTVIFAAVSSLMGKRSVVGWLAGESVATAAVLQAVSIWANIKSDIEEMKTIYDSLKAVEGLLGDMEDFAAKIHVPLMAET